MLVRITITATGAISTMVAINDTGEVRLMLWALYVHENWKPTIKHTQTHLHSTQLYTIDGRETSPIADTLSGLE